MTKQEFICAIASKAGISASDAARVADAIFEADGGAILEALQEPAETGGDLPRKGRRSKHGRGRRKPRLTEAQIRARLIEGFNKVRGMEIEDVFPGGWSESLHP